jgi:predicted nucleotidyltransferase
MASAISANNKRVTAETVAKTARRLQEAEQEILRLVVEFRKMDPELKKVVLFGSVAEGRVRNPDFDIDLAVDSEKYLRLLGICLDSSFKIDLIDLGTANKHILAEVNRRGKVLYAAG